MDQVEFYSGEPMRSPEVFIDPSDNSNQFAVNARDMYGNPAPAMQYNPYNPYGMYNQQQAPYGFINTPQMQPMFPQQVNVGYGYNQQPVYNPYFQQGAPMNYPAMPVQQNSVQTLDPSRMNTGFVGNPAIALMNQWQQQGTPYRTPNSYYDPYTQRVVYTAPPPVQQYQYTPPVVQDRVITVPGYNPSGSIGLLTSDAQEVCEQMQVDMMCEQQAAIAKRQQRSQGYFNMNQMGYTNYYGTPYINNYFDYSIQNKYMNRLQEMKQEAIERRKRLNKRLSMICHNYLKDGVTEADIDRIYDGYTYTIPGNSMLEYQTQAKLERLVPVNNAYIYQEHSRQVSAAYEMICPKGHNMNEYFADLGLLRIGENIEKEYHRRRNTQNYYDTDIYHEYMRKYALEHDIEMKQSQYNKETATKLADLTIEKKGEVTKQDIMDILYTPEKKEELRNKGFIINPDGTTEIKPPDYLFKDNSAPKVEINSENELDYEMRRSAFIASIYNNNRSQVGG